MLSYAVASLLGLPLFFAFLVLVARWERLVAPCVLTFSLFHIASYILTFAAYEAQPQLVAELNFGPLLHLGSYHLNAELLVDRTSLVFLGLSVFCSVVIIRFSRFYLHREVGYRRFYFFILLLIFGLNLLSTANSLDMFFLGWEILGVTSFFLISFYWRQTRSVNNAIMVFTIYRVGDLGLLLSAWLTHLNQQNAATFVGMSELVKSLQQTPDSDHHLFFVVVSALLLLAAAAKSAQLPFSFWLTRAMEGPTPSSAIFYGALSIHAGVLLLLRSAPLIMDSMGLRVVVAVLGLTTAIVATICGRTQSTAKGQIAYAAITQVGLMFIEIAAGFHTFVLYHVVAHSLLRVFQLLVSPSIIAQYMSMAHRPQKDVTVLSRWNAEKLFPRRFRLALYSFAIQDGGLERFLKTCFLEPIIRYPLAASIVGASSVYLAGHDYHAVVLALGVGAQVYMGILALNAYRNIRLQWLCLGASHAALGLSVACLGGENILAGLGYLLTILLFWSGGWYCCLWAQRKYRLYAGEYNGLLSIQPRYMRILILCALAMAAIPPSPVFVFEDLLLHTVSEVSLFAALPISAMIAMNGVTVIRLASQLALGPLRVRAQTGVES